MRAFLSVPLELQSRRVPGVLKRLGAENFPCPRTGPLLGLELLRTLLIPVNFPLVAPIFGDHFQVRGPWPGLEAGVCEDSGALDVAALAIE